MRIGELELLQAALGVMPPGGELVLPMHDLPVRLTVALVHGLVSEVISTRMQSEAAKTA